jgi:hypothetical protein
LTAIAANSGEIMIDNTYEQGLDAVITLLGNGCRAKQQTLAKTDFRKLAIDYTEQSAVPLN